MANFIVGLTGGIGSGKTTIANKFAELGIEIIDADIVAREVVEPNTPALKKIVEHFGKDILLADQSLDRAKLREIIFSDAEQKSWLNNLLHPIIRSEIINQLTQANSQYCILVAPLLLENNLQKLVNRVVIIDVDTEAQISRTCNRDKVTKQQVENIIASQIDRKTRLSLADDVIDNQNANFEDTTKKVLELHQKYLKLALSQ